MVGLKKKKGHRRQNLTQNGEPLKKKKTTVTKYFSLTKEEDYRDKIFLFDYHDTIFVFGATY